MKKLPSKSVRIELNGAQRKSYGRSAKKACKQAQQLTRLASVESPALGDLAALRDYWCALSKAAAEECERLGGVLP